MTGWGSKRNRGPLIRLLVSWPEREQTPRARKIGISKRLGSAMAMSNLSNYKIVRGSNRSSVRRDGSLGLLQAQVSLR